MSFVEILASEVRWPQWPILQTTITNQLVKELLIQVPQHVSTKMWGAPLHWKDIYNRVLRR
jgi:hypothetical protein